MTSTGSSDRKVLPFRATRKSLEIELAGGEKFDWYAISRAERRRIARKFPWLEEKIREVEAQPISVDEVEKRGFTADGDEVKR